MNAAESTFITSYFAVCAGSSLRAKLEAGKFAALRLNKNGQIRDGKVYVSERGMKANRKGRPSDARMFYVESRTRGFFKLIEIA